MHLREALLVKMAQQPSQPGQAVQPPAYAQKMHIMFNNAIKRHMYSGYVDHLRKKPGDLEGANKAAKEAGTRFFTEQLTKGGGQMAGEIQGFSRWAMSPEARGHEYTQFRLDPARQKELGTLLVGKGLAGKAGQLADKASGLAGYVMPGFGLDKKLKNMDPNKIAYDKWIKGATSGLLENTRNMSATYASARNKKIMESIKGWFGRNKGWVIPTAVGGLGLMAIAGMGGDDEKKPEPMGHWTENRYYGKHMNPPMRAPRGFSDVFKNFMGVKR